MYDFIVVSRGEAIYKVWWFGPVVLKLGYRLLQQVTITSERQEGD